MARTRGFRDIYEENIPVGDFLAKGAAPRIFRKGLPLSPVAMTPESREPSLSYKSRGIYIRHERIRRTLSTRGLVSPEFSELSFFERRILLMTAAYVSYVDKKSPRVIPLHAFPRGRILQNRLLPDTEERYLAPRIRGGTRSHPVIIGRIIFRGRPFRDPFYVTLL